MNLGIKLGTTRRGGGGSPWTPAADPGLVLSFLPGEQSYSDAGVTPAVHLDTVRQVTATGNATRAFAQATAGSRPQYRTDVLARPVLRFDGVDDWLNWAGLLLSGVTSFAVVAVLRTRGDGLGDNTRWFGHNSPADNDLGLSFRGNGTTTVGHPGARVGGVESPATAAGPTQCSGVTRAFVAAFVFDGADDLVTVYDGATAGTTQAVAFDPFTGPGDGSGGVGVGALYSGAAPCPIDLGDTYVTTSAAIVTTRYVPYLRNEWGL